MYRSVLFFSFAAKNHSDTQVFFYLWIIFYFISSCYTLIWDLKMDWGLFDKNAGENTFLREGIVYPQKVRIRPALVLEKAFNFLTRPEHRACCSWLPESCAPRFSSSRGH